ncbi:MAG: hypothetical protein Q9225_002071 [Loekoesia sp. 1 TL-2023]
MADRAFATDTDRPTTSRSPTHPGRSQNRPQRSQRVTRSQSRDISDSDIERKKRYQRGPKPTELNGGDRSATQRQPQRGKSKAHNGANALQDLPEMEESSQVSYPELPRQNTANTERAPGAVRRQSGQVPKSPGAASTFSGTTARISGSGQELSGGSAEDMTDALEDLLDASNKVLGLLVPREVSETSVQDVKGRLLDSKSKETKQLQRYTPNFQAQRVVYGDDRFINAPVIVRTVLGVSNIEDVRPGPRRMDPILYRANLASLTAFLMAPSSKNIEDATDELDKLFPKPFLQRFVAKASVGDIADGSALILVTFELAVEIRTRCFIDRAEHLVNEPGFDPDALLQQIFYRDSNTLDGWTVPGMRPEEIQYNKDFKMLIINRLDQLRKTFSEIESPFIDLEGLEKAFSRARLTAALIQWTQLRLREIELQLQSFGGAAGIVQAIRTTTTGGGQIALGTMDEDLSHSNSAHGVVLNFQQASDPDQLKIPEATNQPKGGIDPTNFTFNSPMARPIAVARLKERRASSRSAKAPVDSAPLTTTGPILAIGAPVTSQTPLTKELPSGTPPSWQPPVTEEEEHFAVNRPDLRIQARRFIERRQILEAESNKENLPLQPEPSQIPPSQPSEQARTQSKKGRFLDHQENAERMDWNTQESNSSFTRHSQQPTVDDLRIKRRGEEDNSSSDDDFQEDTRQITQPRRSGLTKKNSQSDAALRPAAKRPRRLQGRLEATESSDLEEAVETHNNDNAPVPSQAERYRVVNAYAKQQIATLPKKPQVRTPWSPEETDRLLELIDQHGLSWTRLKSMDKVHENGPLLGTRDQVALKDKARNIKFDFLK